MTKTSDFSFSLFLAALCFFAWSQYYYIGQKNKVAELSDMSYQAAHADNFSDKVFFSCLAEKYHAFTGAQCSDYADMIAKNAN